MITYRNDNHNFLSNDKRDALIEIIDGCNSKCVCCPRGMGILPNTYRKMPIALYKQIIDKCKQLNVSIISLFNWSEPFLNTDLLEYVKIAKQADMYVCLSSNLSLEIKNLTDIMDLADNLEVSVSGFTQEIYEINHLGCNIEKVKYNLNKIRYYNNVKLKYFLYEYNKQELPMWEDYLQNTNISLLIVDGNEDPLHRISSWGEIENTGEQYKNTIPFTYCNRLKQFTIDIDGNLLLCCEKQYDKSIIIGNFLTDDIGELQNKKFRHNECNGCEVLQREMNILKKHERDMLIKKQLI